MAEDDNGSTGRSGRGGRWTAAGFAAAAATVVGLSLAYKAEPGPVTPPDTNPSSPAAEDVRGPRLGPDGLEGLTLGESVDPEAWNTFFEEGCNRGLTGLTDELTTLGVGTLVRVETEGEEVVAVTLLGRSSSVEAPGTLPDVWLGPTLGDPIAMAVSLPGAQVVTEDPRGADGPGVTSVLVDTAVGQVVFADPPYDQATRSEGRISHITVRQTDQVRCRLFDATELIQPGQAVDPDEPVATIDATGTTDIRLGDLVADAERAGLLLPQTTPPAPGTVPEGLLGCDAWTTTNGTDTVVLADEAGRVVAVGSGGFGVGFSTTFGLSPGQRTDEAAALLGVEPPPAAAGPALTLDGVSIEGEVAPGVRATVVSYPGSLQIETIDAVLTGPLLVTAVTVHLVKDESAPLC